MAFFDNASVLVDRNWSIVSIAGRVDLAAIDCKADAARWPRYIQRDDVGSHAAEADHSQAIRSF
jgi:hypothetical protein